MRFFVVVLCILLPILLQQLHIILLQSAVISDEPGNEKHIRFYCVLQLKDLKWFLIVHAIFDFIDDALGDVNVLRRIDQMLCPDVVPQPPKTGLQQIYQVLLHFHAHFLELVER